MKHTPGPWTVEELNAYHTSYIIRGGVTGNKIAQCFNWQDRGFDVASEENAKLIASAPRLFDENQKLKSALEEMLRRTYNEMELRKIAREALDSCENAKTQAPT